MKVSGFNYLMSGSIISRNRKWVNLGGIKSFDLDMLRLHCLCCILLEKVHKRMFAPAILLFYFYHYLSLLQT